MDVAIGVASYPDISLSELFERANDIDADFVEVVMEGSYRRERLADRASEFDSLVTDETGLVIHLPFGGLDVGSPFEHVRAGAVRELEESVRTADELGAEKAVFHADTYVRPEIWEKPTVIEAVIDSISRLTQVAAGRTVELTVENVPNPFMTVTDFPELFAETEVNATLDTGHARVNRVGDGELSRLLETHGERFTHFHINDTRGPSDDHLPIGMGEIGFESLFRALPSDWSGSMTVEAITTEFEYMELGVERLRERLESIEEDRETPS